MGTDRQSSPVSRFHSCPLTLHILIKCMLILPSEIMFASKQPKHHDKAFVLQKGLHDDAGRINSSLSILFKRPDFIPLLPLKCTSLFKCTFNQLQIRQNVLPSVISVQVSSTAAVVNLLTTNLFSDVRWSCATPNAFQTILTSSQCVLHRARSTVQSYPMNIVLL